MPVHSRPVPRHFGPRFESDQTRFLGQDGSIRFRKSLHSQRIVAARSRSSRIFSNSHATTAPAPAPIRDPIAAQNPPPASVWIGNEQNDRGGDEIRDRPRAYVLLAPSWDDPSNQSRECCADDANTEPHEEFDRLKRLRNEIGHTPRTAVAAGSQRYDLSGKTFVATLTVFGYQRGSSTAAIPPPWYE